MQVVCFYDYVCSYSYNTLRWLKTVKEVEPDLTIEWRTFSISEANRVEGTPSPFDAPEITSTSVLALVLAHAARGTDGADFEKYHEDVFAAMHEDGHHLDRQALLEIAADAGVDTESFERDRTRWLRAMVNEHRLAETGFSVFGTPTLIVGTGGASVFLKLAVPPSPGDEQRVWEALCCLAACHPEVLEIKRPTA
jgi:predicted DsbA family dithiol-disulfide isomerase